MQLAGLGILQLSTPSHPTPPLHSLMLLLALALTETKKTIHQWARDFSKTKFNSCSFGLVFFDRNRVQNLEGRQAFKMFRHRDKIMKSPAMIAPSCARSRLGRVVPPSVSGLYCRHMHTNDDYANFSTWRLLVAL